MKRNQQSELIKQLTDKELLFHLYATQLLLLIISFLLSLFLFDHVLAVFTLIDWNDPQVLYIGGTAGVAVVLLDVVLMKLLPARFYDDGGLNERIFKNRSIVHIAFLAAVIAISEEILFRGVIQTNFGIFVASTIFAVVHIRYLSNLFLFTNVLALSFLIGIIYEWTGNLLVTIFMHFIIDFLLGLLMKYQPMNKNGNTLSSNELE